ncbi:MAG: hypothetical protein HQK54_08625 [Oligoflexales bacterium]|nr:hypothetical protein [Oligoflexales bacterium]
MNNTHKYDAVIYLIESSKGFVATSTPPISGKNNIVCFIGALGNLSVDPVPGFDKMIVGNSYQEVADHITMSLPKKCEENLVAIITTDETFNIASYNIIKKLNNLSFDLYLYDHLSTYNITYKNYFSVRAYIRYRAVLIRAPWHFKTVLFSNGLLGYSMSLPYKDILVFDHHKQVIHYKKIAEGKLLVLIPQNDSFGSQDYLRHINNLLEKIKTTKGDGLFDDLLLKYHPRSTILERNTVENFSLLRSCRELKKDIPLERFDLTGMLVINYDSAFQNTSPNNIFLLCMAFGVSELGAKNMSGTPMRDLDEFDNLVFQHLS